MSTGIASAEERARINADLSSLILMSGNSGLENHAFADWFHQLHFEGWETFENLPMPARTDEAWRFATVKSLDITPYSKPLPVSTAARARLLERCAGLEKTAGRMVFANDELIEHQVFSETLRG